MTTKITVNACCSDEKVVRVLITEDDETVEEITLEDGETTEQYVYDGRQVMVGEVEKG